MMTSDTENKSSWGEFWRIATGVFLMGAGVSIVAVFSGLLVSLLAGFAFVAIGIALLFMK